MSPNYYTFPLISYCSATSNKLRNRKFAHRLRPARLGTFDRGSSERREKGEGYCRSCPGDGSGPGSVQRVARCGRPPSWSA